MAGFRFTRLAPDPKIATSGHQTIGVNTRGGGGYSETDWYSNEHRSSADIETDLDIEPDYYSDRSGPMNLSEDVGEVVKEVLQKNPNIIITDREEEDIDNQIEAAFKTGGYTPTPIPTTTSISSSGKTVYSLSPAGQKHFKEYTIAGEHWTKGKVIVSTNWLTKLKNYTLVLDEQIQKVLYEGSLMILRNAFARTPHTTKRAARSPDSPSTSEQLPHHLRYYVRSFLGGKVTGKGTDGDTVSTLPFVFRPGSSLRTTVSYRDPPLQRKGYGFKLSLYLHEAMGHYGQGYKFLSRAFRDNYRKIHSMLGSIKVKRYSEAGGVRADRGFTRTLPGNTFLLEAGGSALGTGSITRRTGVRGRPS